MTPVFHVDVHGRACAVALPMSVDQVHRVFASNWVQLCRANVVSGVCPVNRVAPTVIEVVDGWSIFGVVDGVIHSGAIINFGEMMLFAPRVWHPSESERLL